LPLILKESGRAFSRIRTRLIGNDRSLSEALHDLGLGDHNSGKITMKKKPPVVKSIPRRRAQAQERAWHNGGDIELHLYARSLRRAVRTLLGKLDLKPDPATGWDAAPVILLYRHAIELHLKELAGEGGGLLQNPVDPLTLYKTHSLRWLAQIVCQVIRAAGWDSKFTCEGVADLAAFQALVGELEAADPVVSAVMSIDRKRDGSVPPFLQPQNVVALAKKLDAVLDLVEATADALAAFEMTETSDADGFGFPLVIQ
jgi:hypothetical protein